MIDVSSVPRQLELSVRETIAERPDWCASVILVCSTCLCNVTTLPPLIVSPASTRPLASLSPRYCTWWQRHVHVGHVDLCGVVCVVYCVGQLASGVVISKYRTRNCKSTYLKYESVFFWSHFLLLSSFFFFPLFLFSPSSLIARNPLIESELMEISTCTPCSLPRPFPLYISTLLPLPLLPLPLTLSLHSSLP